MVILRSSRHLQNGILNHDQFKCKTTEPRWSFYGVQMLIETENNHHYMEIFLFITDRPEFINSIASCSQILPSVRPILIVRPLLPLPERNSFSPLKLLVTWWRCSDIWNQAFNIIQAAYVQKSQKNKQYLTINPLLRERGRSWIYFSKASNLTLPLTSTDSDQLVSSNFSPLHRSHNWKGYHMNIQTYRRHNIDC